MVKKFTNTVPWIYVVSNLNGEEIVETFYEKNCKRKIKHSLDMKKQPREKVINVSDMSNGKIMIIRLIVG